MSSPLKQNTTSLQELLEEINSLPTYVDTTSATASASDILNGKTAYVDGKKVTGTIPTQAAQTITPGTSDKTAVSSGVYTTGATIVKGDANLKAENILSGKSIFGVSGGIPNNGSVSQTMDGINTKSVSIPAGYTSGGSVSLDNTIDNAVADAIAALVEKEVEVPDGTDVTGLAALIEAIEAGGHVEQGTVTPSYNMSASSLVVVDKTVLAKYGFPFFVVTFIETTTSISSTADNYLRANMLFLTGFNDDEDPVYNEYYFGYYNLESQRYAPRVREYTPPAPLSNGFFGGSSSGILKSGSTYGFISVWR